MFYGGAAVQGDTGLGGGTPKIWTPRGETETTYFLQPAAPSSLPRRESASACTSSDLTILGRCIVGASPSKPIVLMACT